VNNLSWVRRTETLTALHVWGMVQNLVSETSAFFPTPEFKYMLNRIL